MTRKTPAPYMTLAAANFFLKYAKARGVSKVARGESKSAITKIGFMQAYAKAKGNHKKLQTMMATPRQTWDERRNNFVARHMAQVTKRGEALYETSGKYKGWPTRRHLGLIMWAMTPDPRGVGNLIARERGLKTRTTRANGLSKRRRASRASTGRGIRVPDAWVNHILMHYAILQKQAQGQQYAAVSVTLPLDVRGLSERLRVLLAPSAPLSIKLRVFPGYVPHAGLGEASGTYSALTTTISLAGNLTPTHLREVARHELAHMIQHIASEEVAGRMAEHQRVARPPAREYSVGVRRVADYVRADFAGTVRTIRTAQGDIAIKVTDASGTRSKNYVLPSPESGMTLDRIYVDAGQAVAKGQILFSLLGTPARHSPSTPNEFEAYLGEYIVGVENAASIVYRNYATAVFEEQGEWPSRERVAHANDVIRDYVASFTNLAKFTDARARRDATKRIIDAGVRAIAELEESIGFVIDRHMQRRTERARAVANPRYTSARRDDPELWEEVKAAVTRGTKGGKAGQWSARKAQFAVAEYQRRGGGYIGPKSPRNALAKWTREEWGTKSGRASLKTGERYLPKAAREALTPAEYAETTRAKRAGLRRGEQFTRQPKRIARKTAKYRK